MSGHSHYAGIKHKKEATDAQRGKAFSRLAKELTIAARGGNNPETNSKLRVVIEKAKSINMPKDNVERAINKGSGNLDGVILEEILVEGYGPGGVAILIDGITDNKNRTINEIKQILGQHGGKFVESGSIKWMFEQKGVIVVPIDENAKKEDIELKAIEAGAEDLSWKEDSLLIFVNASVMETVKNNLSEKGIEIDSANMEWVPKEAISVVEKDRDACERLFDVLSDNDSVNDVYSNIYD